MLQTYVSNVSGISDALFQVFHLDISKVDLGVPHIAMATHMFQAHVSSGSSVSDLCCKCFI
jgi:hypothetical protein